VPFTSSHARACRCRPAAALALALLTGFSSKSAGAQDAPAAEARQIPDGLNFANGLFRDRRYKMAAEEYERFLKEAEPGRDANDAWFGLANARLFQGQYAEARRAFESFRKAAPEHPNAATALYRIGETSYMLGDLATARRALEGFTAEAKGHRFLETAWPYLAEVCFRMHDLPRARQAYEQALSTSPQGRLADRARFGLGRTLAAQGEADEARRVLEELAKRGGDWTDRAWFEIAQVEFAAGRFAESMEAVETLERLAPKSPLIAEARLSRAESLAKLGRHDEAETVLKTLENEAPHNLAAKAAFALGTSQLDRGDAEKALATLDDARTRFPKTPIAPALTFRSAEAALKLGRADDARARFLSLAESAPKDPLADDAVLRAARLALEARDHAAAKELAAGFSTRFPESPLRADAHLIEARIAMVERRPKDAITILTSALDREKPAPETAQALSYYLGLAYRADGQAQKGAEVLDALAKTPAAPAAANAQFLVGQGHFEAKRYAEAIPALEKYLAAKPDGEVAANALTYLVWARLELGQTDEASQTLERLAGRFPKSKSLAPTRLRLGWVLLDKNKPVEAAAEFAAALKSAPDDRVAPEAAWGRARALDAAKQPDEALKAYAEVESTYPKSEQAKIAAIARARLLVEQNQSAEAAAVYETYLRDHADLKAAPPGAEVDTLLSEWGWALVDAGKTGDADRVFDRLLREFPESAHAADARVNLADSAYRAKQYDQVLSLLAPLVAEGAKPPARLAPSALLLYAQAQDKRQDSEGAAKTLDRLDRDYPDNRYRREARFLRAEVALKLGDAEAAEKGFAALAAEPAADSDPERFGPAIRRGRIQSLLVLKRWDDVLAAADEFEKQSANDPLRSDVDFARGRALQGLARFDEARAAFQAVIKARKGGELAARAQLMRGETYFHQKDYQNALREFFMVDTLYEAPTWQAAALLEVGKVYERLDRWSLAAETYEGLCAKFPKDPSAAEAKSRLEAARRHAQGATNSETR
jgi:TolA-binding protein